MSTDSHPVVKAYNHATDKWSETKIVAHSPFVDKHNYPGMLRGTDGRRQELLGTAKGEVTSGEPE